MTLRQGGRLGREVFRNWDETHRSGQLLTEGAKIEER